MIVSLDCISAKIHAIYFAHFCVFLSYTSINVFGITVIRRGGVVLHDVPGLCEPKSADFVGGPG
ncbi:hypothetical protein A2363_03725 [Candidatus Gottesmanbacteria bacterium RIFOXYB1_FULL_47_11]|uniref:Uncharacterized protein n=1 Tax=Candidatus Gottesmanbacteria bacterium RIFOXYB1_FULL_47_11 TaxID=1798401 RepID=A0A1F6BC06_9BACT|nr:MAG: hypothetical protein A2363_03725 [Candidatus Gottesmanbacteria bacterium RIFOXYB1_FULL_47_11]